MGETDIGKKRRLPSWMSSSSAIVPKKESPSSKLEEAPLVKKQAGRKTGRAPPAKKPKTQTRRRRHQSFSSSADDDDEDPISVEEDAADNIQQQKQEEDEEDELTVHDLITIAQEYVEADDARAKQHGVTAEPNSRSTTSSTFRKKKLQEATTEPDSEEQIETTSLTSRNDSGGSIFGIEASLPTLTSLGPSSNSDREHFSTGETIYSSCKTGDPTQDMLDLFLGPLLNKPNKIALTKHESLREEIGLDYGLEKPSQKEEAEKPPLTKKKSSLRDKVAMFLD